MPVDLGDLRHIAVIMDGNGRWARSRNLRRTFGHREGVSAVRDIATECARAGLERLTLYALSTENYLNRPGREIRVLMLLLRRFLIEERPTLMENRIRLQTIGRVADLPSRVLKEVETSRRMTAGNDGMILTLALNYGGQAEIADATRSLARQVVEGKLAPDDIDEKRVSQNLYDPDMPGVDLLIRTGGEMRVSNFLLWQMSYAEIWVTDTLWPDFRAADLQEAAEAYRGRSRKFGGLVEGIDH